MPRSIYGDVSLSYYTLSLCRKERTLNTVKCGLTKNFIHKTLTRRVPLKEPEALNPGAIKSELGKDRRRPPQDPLTPGHKAEGPQQDPK